MSSDGVTSGPTRPDFVLSLSRGFLLRLFAFVSFSAVLLFFGKILLVAFAAMLFAILLRSATSQLERVVPLNSSWAYGVVVCTLFAAITLLGYFAGPQIITQTRDVPVAIRQSLDEIQRALNRYDWGHDVIEFFSQGIGSSQNARRVADYAGKAVEGATNGIIVIVVGLFLGANPRLYRSGLLQLVPEQHRSTAIDLLNNIAAAVRGWLIGQLFPMAALGVGTLVGLWILNVPLAFTLALFTALMLFVPYVGSVLAFIPTALVALTRGSSTAAYVTVVYLAVHIAEAYVITPIAQRHAIRLPPALTLLAEFFMWTVGGPLGVLVATPLTAVVIVIVQQLYLKKQPDLRG
jgi:predicted PurR-regulated permease PerM